ncbi:kelch repeat-containing protein [Variovorax sp. J22R24]|uniref:kelch repeat-containing protein n=1 Tax=Variovorax gracilis TaxID=3053502 RepID=UPI00257604C5|nr:kelch repeat-containing protein [Variovorax sp. J22R24]MDM0109063.1 kelch repeat-containing protein [Variovorax sp. J22R24]
MNTTSWQGALRLLAWGLASFLTLLCMSACGGGGGGGFNVGGNRIDALYVPPAGLHFARDRVVYQLGQAIDANAPSSGGGTILRYTVAPALPEGLQIDPATGVISGTPRMVAAPTLYTVTGINFAGSVTTGLEISVKAGVVPPANLSFENPDAIYTVGQPIPPNHPSLEGGDVSGFAVQPALPDGLVIDPISGVISGTPTRDTAPANFTVTASNSGGSTRAVLRIEVRTAFVAPGSLNYSEPNAIYAEGRPIVPNHPKSTGGAMTGFVAVPPLPQGLSMDPVSGVISGTPQGTRPAAEHTVTGSNEAGSVSAKLSITVVAPGTWLPTASMGQARTNHTASLLADGTVLVAGGYDDSDTLATAEFYAPSTGLWSITNPMSESRFFHTATVLSDGRVLAAGGEYSGGYRATAELYDPATLKWAPTGSMSTARSGHTATLLPNGKVLIAGGYDGAYLDTAELYDPATGLWTAASPMNTARSVHTASLLSNGKVLVAGGFGGTALAAAELYDPVTGLWTATAPLMTARLTHSATVLPDARVLVAGGFGGGVSLASAELYDPAAGLWTPTGSMTTPRTAETATLLPAGKVMVAGGYNGNTVLATTELYDPASGLWAATGSLAGARYFHTATLLPGGNVLATGGYDAQSIATVELQVP